MSDSAQRTLRTIVAGMPGILALKNKKLAYEVVNPQFCQFLARGPEEITGKTDSELFPAAEAAAATKEQKSVLSSGITRRAELQLSGKEGPRWFDVTLSAVLDDNGDPDGVMIAGHDITTFKQREAAVSSAEARVTEAEQRATAAQEKLTQLHDEAKALEVAAQQVQDHLKQREKQLAQTLKQTTALETQVKETQDALAAAEAKASDADSRVHAAEARAGEMERAANEAKAYADALTASADEAKARAERAENDAATLRQKQADAATLVRQLAEKLG